MTALDELIVESSRRLAAEYRTDVRWHVAKARKALEMGDVEEARWRLSRAKVWRVRAHHWTQRAREGRGGLPGRQYGQAAR